MDMQSWRDILAAALALAVVVLPLALARWLVRRRSDARAGNEVAHTIDHDQHPPPLTPTTCAPPPTHCWRACSSRRRRRGAGV